MIVNPPITKLLESVDCRYTLIVEVSKRARQIVAGARPLLDTDETKPVSIAVQEVSAGIISYRREEDTL
ncbi:MAG: DNA-directed RNA polymerase subunit omega [Christensenellaceae bacterium]|jgi:DNA-directed RNA polymerase subunit omega|nr:DNA-directed RNA polymerase subunit omega [Christensenellaceae bacterium]